MPVQAKILHEDQTDLAEMVDLAGIEELLIEPSQSHESVVRFFAPYAAKAKNEFTERKVKQQQAKYWLETIVDRQNSINQAKMKMTELATKAKTQAGSGMGM